VSTALDVSSLTPEQEAILNSPPDDTPEYDGRSAHLLHYLGNPKKARRLDNCGTFYKRHRHKRKDGQPGFHTWSQNNSRCMLTIACPFCGKMHAREQCKAYRILTPIVPEHFTTVEISYPFDKDVKSSIDRAATKFSKLLPSAPTLSKAVYREREGGMVTKGIYFGAITDAEMVKLRKYLTNSTVTTRLHSRHQYECELFRLTDPELPESAEKRVMLESKLDGLRLFRAARVKGHAQLVVKDTPITTNSTPADDSAPKLPRETPPCPHCGEPAEESTDWFRGDPRTPNPREVFWPVHPTPSPG
jgi:hypothetical protein